MTHKHDCEQWIDEGVCCKVCQPFARNAAAASFDRAWGVTPEFDAQQRATIRSALLAALASVSFPEIDDLATALGVDFREPNSEGKIADALLAQAAADGVGRSAYRQPRNNVQRRRAAYERGRRDAMEHFTTEPVAWAVRRTDPPALILHVTPHHLNADTLASMQGVEVVPLYARVTNEDAP